MQRTTTEEGPGQGERGAQERLAPGMARGESACLITVEANAHPTAMFVTPAKRRLQARRLCEGLAGVGLGMSCASCGLASELEALLYETSVRLLVLHVDMLQVLGLHCLMRLRGVQPAVDWVLGWQGKPGNTSELTSLALHTRARAAVDLDQPEQVAHALNQVSAGQLWLPRWMLHQAYAELMDDHRTRAASAAPDTGLPGPRLTRREAAALELLHHGLTNREIGERLEISVSTVKKHLKNALDKRGLHNRRQALG